MSHISLQTCYSSNWCLLHWKQSFNLSCITEKCRGHIFHNGKFANIKDVELMMKSKHGEAIPQKKESSDPPIRRWVFQPQHSTCDRFLGEIILSPNSWCSWWSAILTLHYILWHKYECSDDWWKLVGQIGTAQYNYFITLQLIMFSNKIKYKIFSAKYSNIIHTYPWTAVVLFQVILQTSTIHFPCLSFRNRKL